VDHASSGGTYVNDRQIARAAVRDGDVLALGSSTLLAFVGAGAEARARTAATEPRRAVAPAQCQSDLQDALDAAAYQAALRVGPLVLLHVACNPADPGLGPALSTCFPDALTLLFGSAHAYVLVRADASEVRGRLEALRGPPRCRLASGLASLERPRDLEGPWDTFAAARDLLLAATDACAAAVAGREALRIAPPVLYRRS
jgi:hypothetical protein